MGMPGLKVLEEAGFSGGGGGFIPKIGTVKVALIC